MGPTADPSPRAPATRLGPETVVGIDFGGPATASAQRRKIVAVAARRIGPRAYAIDRGGLNARLLRAPPGWTAGELAEALAGTAAAIRVVAADFPFSIPAPLLASVPFARRAGRPRAFGGWSAFNAAVAGALPLACPVDYGPFDGWRERAFWTRRECDRGCGAQPPLKDRFQVLFNMTLLGNAFLARLEASGRFDVVPFQARGRAEVIEVYPGHLLRSLGVRGYKRAPREAIEAALRLVRRHGIAVAVAPSVRAACERWDTGAGTTHDHDAADALVAACAAILYREGEAREVAGAGPAARALEGTIWSAAAGGAARRGVTEARRGTGSPPPARGAGRRALRRPRGCGRGPPPRRR